MLDLPADQHCDDDARYPLFFGYGCRPVVRVCICKIARIQSLFCYSCKTWALSLRCAAVCSLRPCLWEREIPKYVPSRWLARGPTEKASLCGSEWKDSAPTNVLSKTNSATYVFGSERRYQRTSLCTSESRGKRTDPGSKESATCVGCDKGNRGEFQPCLSLVTCPSPRHATDEISDRAASLLCFQDADANREEALPIPRSATCPPWSALVSPHTLQPWLESLNFDIDTIIEVCFCTVVTPGSSGNECVDLLLFLSITSCPRCRKHCRKGCDGVLLYLETATCEVSERSHCIYEEMATYRRLILLPPPIA